MSKQKLNLSLSLVLILLSSLVVLPQRANAGQAVVQGTSSDSSSISGDSFAPGPEAGSGSDGTLQVPQIIQDRVNRSAAEIISRSGKTNLIIILVLGKDGADNAAAQVRTNFVNLGASPEIVQELVRLLYGLCFSRTATTPGLPNAQVTAGDLVASLKVLKTTSAIAQVDPTLNVNINAANVDINQLNAAINAYNQIVRESSLATLEQLSKDENFQEAGRVLRELRASLK
ncbi:hypothetical protein A0J48_006805 [Sphaerospermopsis aphanizomenoides BCCUSP55]|uniref:hypothetical protein n=1 Tax=Sphaerospermopsis aphanizomenoides TaxID=459663 RepID=UPI000AA47BF3|nr:hypothetical protein [Sphaerospermopsis aphanizomenoides]MBK1987246.1 hypothetical protein [Sphaerospermopsis aphanizomenoides BCCUSP55]